jgi:hypothetical protein
MSKNIHILSTDKPSRLYSKDGNHKLDNSTMAMDWYISSAGYKPHNIYITNDEKIEGGDWILIIDDFQTYVHEHKGDNLPTTYCKKIILTNEQRLIDDGVQAIDDEFLKWFVKNPSCEWVKIESWQTKGEWELDYKIIIPQEKPKQFRD